MDGEDASYVAREAMCIKEAKSVWAILREGAVRRKVVPWSGPSGSSFSLINSPIKKGGMGKGKKRRNCEYVEEEETWFNGDWDGDEPPAPAVVAEHAWPVLEWLLMLFEKDEVLTEKSGLRESLSPSSLFLP